ncbi:MAG: MFS transporter, partial [archaeon]|nr:MFS transporter [archaeon]
MNSIRSDYAHTIRACYVTYVIQAIIVTIQPLLFVTFSTEFGFSLEELALLTTFNFLVQLIFDILCTKIVSHVGYRKAMLICMSLITLGLLGMVVFPYLTDPYIGLLLGTVIFGSGGGISEVLVNPIVLSCPTDSKEGALTLLHSFFCWGQVLVVLGSTAFFMLFGTGDWRILVVLWALVPAVNLIYFSLVPMNENEPGLEKEGTPFKQLFSMKVFWLFVILMLCGGAAEHAVGQWA